MDASTDAPAASQVVVPSFVTPDFSKFGVSVDGMSIAIVFFGVIFLWWAIHTIIALYHWARYGRTSWFAVPIVVGYLIVSVRLIFFIIGTLR